MHAKAVEERKGGLERGGRCDRGGRRWERLAGEPFLAWNPQSADRTGAWRGRATLLSCQTRRKSRRSRIQQGVPGRSGGNGGIPQNRHELLRGFRVARCCRFLG